MDYLSYLEENNQDFWSHLDRLWLEAEFPQPVEMQELPDQWQDDLVEPSAEELAWMDKQAALLLMDLENDNEDQT